MPRLLVLMVILATSSAHAEPKSTKQPSIAVVVVNHSNARLRAVNVLPSTAKGWGQDWHRGDEFAVPIKPGKYRVRILGTTAKALYEGEVQIDASIQFEILKGGKVVTSKPDPKHVKTLLGAQGKADKEADRAGAAEAKEAAANRKAKRHWELSAGACSAHTEQWCGTIVFANGAVSSCIQINYQDDNTSDHPLPATIEFGDTVNGSPVTRLHFVANKANVRYVLSDDCHHVSAEPLD